MSVTLRSATEALLVSCRANDWSGHDPYDALNSQLLRGIGLLNWRLPRLVITQLLKRCPLNFRVLLRVPREQNPKGIAVFLTALVKLQRLGLAGVPEVRTLASRLIELRSANQPLAGWGYNFDWQTRTYLVPRSTPNIICTTFAGQALLDAYDAFLEPQHLELAVQAGRFVLEGLLRSETPDGLCFSYTPLRRSRVHNANLLGAALLARLFAQTGMVEFRQTAEAATRYGLRHQQADGSWIYGEDANQGWIDSFHTGYNLMALEQIRRCLGIAECEASIRRGYRFYLDHFFETDGRAKYFHNRTYPIDAHSIAQALITLTGLEAYDTRSRQQALQVAAWALENMRSPEGWFYYQEWPLWTNRINYMRWSQAWMLLALASLAEAEQSPAMSGLVALASASPIVGDELTSL